MADSLIERINAIPYWYHRIDLGNGVVTPGWAPINPDAYRIPDRMFNETVLDVGAWDGYWTFESLKRGAKHVTAIEDFSDTCGEITNADRRKQWETFDLCAEALGYRKEIPGWCAYNGEYQKDFDHPRYERCNLSIERDSGGDFYWSNLDLDRVFCFGVLYHLCNPLKALQNCFDSLKPGGTIHVETAILDNITSAYTGKPHDPNGCYAEFFPTNEFGRNSSNWWVPTLRCAAAWLQAAGFVDIEQWKLTDNPNSLAECRGFLKAKKPT